MEKDFDAWNTSKKQIHNSNDVRFCNEREVWWCTLGVNIGYEQDGKREDFSRPVVILKTYSTNACLIVPLTSRKKNGVYYYNVGIVAGRSATAILSQLRFVDKKRLINKICFLQRPIFKRLKEEIVLRNLT